MEYARRLLVVAVLTGLAAGLGGCDYLQLYPGQWTYDVIGEGGQIGVEQISLAQPIVRGHTVVIKGVARVPVRTIQWTWGDGNSTTTDNFPGSHTYLRAGRYSVVVRVFTADGRTLGARAYVRIREYWAGAGHLALFAPTVQGRRVTIDGALRDASLRRLHWTWGDGTVSNTSTFPGTHTYARAGLYTVGVVAYTKAGTLVRANTTVRVGGPSWPGVDDLTLSPPVVDGRMVSVAGAVRVPFNIIRWTWGDGKTTTTPSFPGRHLYRRAGVYTITVQVHTKSGAVLRSGTVVRIAEPPPLPSLTLLPPVVAGRGVTINGSVNRPLKRLRWFWGDGKSSETTAFPGTHIYAGRGVYTVNVEAQTRAGKTLQGTVTVRILGPPLLPRLTLLPPVVAGRGVTINGSVNVPFNNIIWVWGDGTATTTTAFPGTHIYARRGVYAVTVKAQTRRAAAAGAEPDPPAARGGRAPRDYQRQRKRTPQENRMDLGRRNGHRHDGLPRDAPVRAPRLVHRARQGFHQAGQGRAGHGDRADPRAAAAGAEPDPPAARGGRAPPWWQGAA